MDEIKENATGQMTVLSKEYYLDCFEEGKSRDVKCRGNFLVDRNLSFA